MKKIAVFCAAGMSTSLLVKKMNEVAKNKGLDVQINAYSENEMIKHTDVDAVLLGPQVQFVLPKAKSIFEPHGISVTVINSVDYGMMNGDKILTNALNQIK